MRFGGLQALSRVSLTVPEGGVVSLIGPNGAGKTTLFNVISGTQASDEGRVELRGVNLGSLSAAARAKRGLVRTFQRMQLFEELSVLENLIASRECEEPLRLVRGMFQPNRAKPADVEDAEEIAGLLGLSGSQHQRVADLSTGVRRLVELGRCMMTDASMLLLDEPSSGLDRAETERFIEVVREIHSQRGGARAILIVEHDMTVALGLAEYVYVLDFGELIAEGTPAAIRANARVQAAYLGQEG